MRRLAAPRHRLHLATPLLTRRARRVVPYAARLAAAEAARAASDRHVVRAFVAELPSSRGCLPGWPPPARWPPCRRHGICSRLRVPLSQIETIATRRNCFLFVVVALVIVFLLFVDVFFLLLLLLLVLLLMLLLLLVKLLLLVVVVCCCFLVVVVGCCCCCSCC